MSGHGPLSTDTQINAASAAQLCFEIEEMLRKIEQNADHYQIFGIGRRATPEEIKKAYREYAKKFHPDMHSQLAAFNFQVKTKLESIFARIETAYEILRDETKRRKYDGMLRFPGIGTPVPGSLIAKNPNPAPVSYPEQKKHQAAPPVAPVAQPSSQGTTPRRRNSQSMKSPITPPAVEPNQPKATPPIVSAPPPPVKVVAPPAPPPSFPQVDSSKPVPQPIVAAPQPLRMSAEDYFAKCLECIEKNDLLQAYQHISRAVELKPREAAYRIQLARILINMPGLHKKQAEEHFLLAIDLEKDDAKLAGLYQELANFYRSSGLEKHAAEMEAHIQALLKPEPGDAQSVATPSQNPKRKTSKLKRIGRKFQKFIDDVLK